MRFPDWLPGDWANANWVREPLVHFLIGGALLFGWFAWQGTPVDPADRTISIDRETLAGIASGFEQQLGRAPSDAELDNLTDRYVREEVLYREALRLGLDQNDAVVRRRLAQKMDLIAGSQAEVIVPTDAILQSWLDDHPARFAADASYTFDQIFGVERPALDLALRSGDLASRSETSSSGYGIPREVSAMPRREVAARFGQQFARGLDDLEPDEEWQGPIPSGLGWHLVRLRELDAGAVPALADIRQQVEDDWRLGTAAAREQKAYQLLRDAYTVEIDR